MDAPVRHPIPEPPTHYVFSQAPWLVYWEVTRACDLACRHCRAEAIRGRDPRELSTGEGMALLDAVRRFGDRPPHVVITGGDPLRRPDLFDLIAYGRAIGLDVALAPSVTPLLERAVFVRLRALGVTTVSLSLDGADAPRHDGIRGIPGCFDRTLELARAAVEEGLDLQINTLVTADTLEELPRIEGLVADLGALRWSLFFLIPVGRGALLRQITAEQAEALCRRLADRVRESPFQIKTTEAPQFRRVVVQRLQARGLSMADVRRLPVARGFGVRDGNGILFVSHTGEVYPSGFLPWRAGNVRHQDLVGLYREGRVFREIRDVHGFLGKCGRCEFRTICGGSRARAYAATGNPLESDPLCPYEPGSEGPAGAGAPATPRAAASRSAASQP